MEEKPGITFKDIASNGQLQVGYSRIDITPYFPVNFDGYKKRYGKIEVLDKIYAKALSLDNKLIIVSIDLMFIPIRIYSKIAKLFPTQTLLLSATHTHAAPSPICKDYQPFLEAKLTEVISKSMDDLTHADMFIGNARCDLAMNRRLLIRAWKNLKKLRVKKTVEMRPNPKGAADKNLTILKVVSNHRIIYLVNYACHAGMWHGLSISADWPGRIKLDGEVMFIQGFCGNTIPYYKKENNTIKDLIIATAEGTKDFRKWNTSEADMEHAARMIERSIYGITEYRKV